MTNKKENTVENGYRPKLLYLGDPDMGELNLYSPEQIKELWEAARPKYIAGCDPITILGTSGSVGYNVFTEDLKKYFEDNGIKTEIPPKFSEDVLADDLTEFPEIRGFTSEEIIESQKEVLKKYLKDNNVDLGTNED